MSLTTEQLEQRLNYITGSDCAIILGVSPWGNAIELWQQKTRLAIAPDISAKPAVRAGIYLEPVVRQWFSDETNKRVTTDNNDMLVHPTISYMAGNIDGKIVGESAILECKTSGFDKGWGKDGDNTIPDYYLAQVAHYVCVCNVERAYIAVLIGGSDFRHYVYERNSALEQIIINKQAEFWECVQSGKPPEPRNSKEMLSLHGYQSINEPVIADTKIEAYVECLVNCKEEIANLEKDKEILEEKIKLFMGKNDTLVSPYGKICATWKESKPVKRFDLQSFRAEHNETYNQFVKECSATRRFCVK